MVKKFLKYAILGVLGVFVFLIILGSLIGKSEANKKFTELTAQGTAYFEKGNYQEAITTL